MYARSSSFLAELDTIDDAIAFCRDEVLTTIEGLEGCVGLSLMVDRHGGRCIATSAWQNIDTMRNSENLMSRLRNRGAAIMGSTPMVEEWEINLLHRDHRTGQGACTRSSWIQVDPIATDLLAQVMRDSLPELDATDGFCSASLLMSRESGTCVATTTWDSRASLEQSRATADLLRAGIADQSGGRILEVVEFELALAHLRVPELV